MTAVSLEMPDEPKKINQLIANKTYNLFTYQLVYSLTKTVLLLLCLKTYHVYK